MDDLYTKGIGWAKRKRRRDLEAAIIERRVRRRRLSERARLATVGFEMVSADEPDRFPKIIGSGIAVDGRGVILTARHVVLDLEAIVMKEARVGRRAAAAVIVSAPPQRSQEAGQSEQPGERVTIGHTTVRIVKTAVNRHHDIAMVGIQGEYLLQSHMKLSADMAPQEGDPVATCGWPYGAELYPEGPRFSLFLVGNVSAVVPHPELNARSRLHYLMQLPVNPGNSGGGVFDPDTGEVFGVVSGRLEVGGIPTGLSIDLNSDCYEPRRVESHFSSEDVHTEHPGDSGSSWGWSRSRAAPPKGRTRGHAPLT